jgi:transcription antitermination factor NusG
MGRVGGQSGELLTETAAVAGAMPADVTAPGARAAGPVVAMIDRVAPAAAWHAVWTRGRHEPGVCADLTARGIDAFLPTITRISRWSDRTKRIAWPLFPGYCFARFEPAGLSSVIRCTGVVSVLSNAGRPIPIPSFEIEALQKLVAAGLTYDPWPVLVPGARVRVVGGPLEGVVGRLIRKGPEHLLVLAVELLRSGARVQVAAGDVQPL